MCGIAGFALTKSVSSLDTDLLQRMQSTIAHRGPNASAIWVDYKNRIGFAHRRLSILDLTHAGAQPMVSADNLISIVFNGEIYNHPELRCELELEGCPYKSNSDTETILYAYQKWGINFIHQLNGMFAIAIFDRRTDELYLIRDRLGIKPLYFSWQDQALSFASEIKALWDIPWIEKKINPLSVYHYLTYMSVPAPFTLYQGIYKLPPGFYLKFSQNKISLHRWYDLLDAISSQDMHSLLDECEIIAHLQSMLRNSIKQQALSDVPYGVFLSGGIDSSLNVALMSEFTDRVKTFTVSFSDGPEYSELDWARKVAQRFNTDHHEVVISEKEAFEFYHKMVYHQDEPLADCVCIPLYYVAKLAKDCGVTVVQVGEGSDELFCGYSTYAQYINLYSRLQTAEKYIPAFSKKGFAEAFRYLFPNKINKLDLLNNWAASRSLFWSGAIAFPEDYKREFLTMQENYVSDPIVNQIFPGLKQDFDSYAIVEYHLQRLHEKLPNADFLTSMVWLELNQRLPELLLMRVDKMTMATSIEARVPFLNHEIVEFAFGLPSHFKYRNGATKYILKKAAEGILPDDIIYRKKMGFAAPTTRWYKNNGLFKSYLLDLLESKNQWWQEFININNVKKMANNNTVTNQDYSLQLWTLQNLISIKL
jgi:asparagine synthase (glutamine-hydrolysing)